MNGELAYEVDIAEAFGAQVERACEPRWLIFLERTQESRSGIQSDVVRQRPGAMSIPASRRLPRQLHEAAAMREQTIEQCRLAALAGAFGMGVHRSSPQGNYESLLSIAGRRSTYDRRIDAGILICSDDLFPRRMCSADTMGRTDFC